VGEAWNASIETVLFDRFSSYCTTVILFLAEILYKCGPAESLERALMPEAHPLYLFAEFGLRGMSALWTVRRSPWTHLKKEACRARDNKSCVPGFGPMRRGGCIICFKAVLVLLGNIDSCQRKNCSIFSFLWQILNTSRLCCVTLQNGPNKCSPKGSERKHFLPGDVYLQSFANYIR
jgi:hypothetical protein